MRACGYAGRRDGYYGGGARVRCGGAWLIYERVAAGETGALVAVLQLTAADRSAGTARVQCNLPVAFAPRGRELDFGKTNQENSGAQIEPGHIELGCS